MSSPSVVVPASVPQAGFRAQAAAVAAALRPDAGLVAIFIGTRLLLVFAALVAEFLLPRNQALTSGASGPLLTSLTSWDGWYYLGISANGYQAAAVAGDYTNVAFPPLYPLLVRVLSLPFPAYQGLVAVLISNVAFLGVLGLLSRLGTPYLGRRRASMAAGLLAIYPFASVFAMAYTESLFLLLVLASFLAAERRHRAWAAIFLALATLCRLQGVALMLPLLILMLRQDGWRPKVSMAWLLLGAVAAAGFLAYVASVTGSTTAYLDAQQAWGRSGFGRAPAGETIAAKISPYQLALVGTLMWSVFLMVFVRRDRMRPEYWLVPVLFIAAELSSGSLEAVGRVTMAAFPYAWILANRRSILWRRAWPIVSIGLFTLVAILSFGGYWVP